MSICFQTVWRCQHVELVGNSAYKLSRLASNKTVPCTVSRTADLPEHSVFRLFIPMFLQFRDCWTKRREHAGSQKVQAAYYTHKRFLLASQQSLNNSVTLFNSSCFSSCFRNQAKQSFFLPFRTWRYWHIILWNEKKLETSHKEKGHAMPDAGFAHYRCQRHSTGSQG